MLLNQLIDEELKKLYAEGKIEDIKEKLKKYNINELLFTTLQSNTAESILESKILMLCDFDANYQNNITGHSVLMLAASRGHTELVKELIAAGAIATQNGHLEVVKELIAAGADLHHTNNKGFTALTYAEKSFDVGATAKIITDAINKDNTEEENNNTNNSFLNKIGDNVGNIISSFRDNNSNNNNNPKP